MTHSENKSTLPVQLWLIIHIRRFVSKTYYIDNENGVLMLNCSVPKVLIIVQGSVRFHVCCTIIMQR